MSLFCAVPNVLAMSENLDKTSFSLEDSLRMAYLHNPEMRSARETVEAQKGRAVTQSSFHGPEVRFEVDNLWEITQEFEAPGALILKSQIAGAEVKIKE